MNGVAVQVVRELNSLTKTQLAERAGMSLGHLSRIESGARQASGDNMRRIADALRVPLEALSYPDFQTKN